MCSKHPHRKTKANASGQGLVGTVQSVLDPLEGIGDLSVVTTSGYKGKSKVHIPGRWPHRRLVIIVSEPDFGQRQMTLEVQKPGAVRRVLMNELMERGVMVA